MAGECVWMCTCTEPKSESNLTGRNDSALWMWCVGWSQVGCGVGWREVWWSEVRCGGGGGGWREVSLGKVGGVRCGGGGAVGGVVGEATRAVCCSTALPPCLTMRFLGCSRRRMTSSTVVLRMLLLT